MGQRTVLVTAHTGKQRALRSARLVASRLAAAGVAVRTLAAELSVPGADEVPAGPAAAEGTELVIVLGGDGALLRAAELSRPAGVPLIGVYLGHVGFLAEAEPDGLADTVDRVVSGDYVVEERMTIDVTARGNGDVIASTWALNEATVEKAARERMIDVVVEVDGRPLSQWGCDGVVCSTPTGSTAYAFSAGGPVVWPEVEALLMVPISAHTLFAPPMVVSPKSELAIELMVSSRHPARFCGAMVGVRSTCRPGPGWRSAAARCPCCWRDCTRREPAAAGSPTGWWRSSACPSPAGGAVPGRTLASMLEEVRINGLGVIDDAVLELSAGYEIGRASCRERV